MPTIKVTKTISRSGEEAYRALREQFSNPQALNAFGQDSPEISWDDAQMKGVFSNGKIEGEFSVSEGNPSTLTIQLKLPMVLTPLKGLIQKSIQNHLEKLERSEE